MTASTKGFLLGLLGVVIFAVSVPATKLATAAPGFAGLDPILIAFGRAAVAGVLSAGYLWLSGAPWPRREQIGPLYLAGLGIVIGWPLFLGLAIQHVDAVHASVISGGLPLATALLTALWLRQKASPAFWALAILGCALVVAYAWLAGGKSGIGAADGLLLLAVLCAAAGYVLGARLAAEMAPEQVISWILVLYAPFCAAVSAFYLPVGPVAPIAWAGFAYVAVFSMWLGFFAWYRGLALGGTMRVSQVQLLQPFLSMLFAVPLLGERLTPLALLFCLAIIGTVALSRKVK